jgi:hypothetical protein
MKLGLAAPLVVVAAAFTPTLAIVGAGNAVATDVRAPRHRSLLGGRFYPPHLERHHCGRHWPWTV